MDMDYKPYLNKIEEVLTASLPSSPDSQWYNNSFGQLFDCTVPGHFEGLINPNRSLIDLGGKRWRPLLLVLLNQAFTKKDFPQEEAFQITPLVEFVHTASLIHDDIEDSSVERRGKPAAYITFGLDTALNAASWLYFEAPVCLKTANLQPEVKSTLHECYETELRRLHLGQAMDIKWHRTPEYFPSQEEYLAMVKCKTGTLSSLAAKCGAIVSNQTLQTVNKAGIIASELGAGFQILDDVLNLTTGNPGKKRGDDIVENKKSLPVILFCQKASPAEKTELLSCFSQASQFGIDHEAVEKAITLLNSKDAINSAKQMAIELIDSSLSALESLLPQDNDANKMIQNLFKSMYQKLL